MSSSTSKYVIPYSLASDTIAGYPTTDQNQAARLDLLLGESGQLTTSVAANTTENKVITLSRTYPGNVSAAVPGRVWVELTSTINGGVTFQWWTNTWTGTATTITGFTLSYQYSTAQSGRVYRWHFLPYL